MVKLYRFKTVGKVTEPYALELMEEHQTRSSARHRMNALRHSDVEYKYVIYDGNHFVSSTL